MKPVVLGIMQNQWFKDPERVRRMLSAPTADPKLRRRLIAYSLFAGCKSGRVLRKTLGTEWCERILWDEASLEIGGHAASVFPADLLHIRALIDREKPSLVVAFGKIAVDAVFALDGAMPPLLAAPHPAARQPDTEVRLRAIRATLDDFYPTVDIGPRNRAIQPFSINPKHNP